MRRAAVTSGVLLGLTGTGVNASSEPYNVVFVLGRPGAGKGTNCEMIEREFGWVHLSAGDLLRAEMKSGSSNGELINRIIMEGKIVPSEITVQLLEQAMRRSGKSKFLIDGFPRNWENCQAWAAHMEDKADVKFVLLLDCPEDVIISRLRARGRTDDNIDTMRKRIHTFNTETEVVLKYYRDLDLLAAVNSNQSKEAVFEDLRDLFRA